MANVKIYNEKIVKDIKQEFFNFKLIITICCNDVEVAFRSFIKSFRRMNMVGIIENFINQIALTSINEGFNGATCTRKDMGLKPIRSIQFVSPLRV